MIRLGGWSRLSTCDWPGKLVTTLFTQGCPWRCGYCHNPELLPPRTPPALDWNVVRVHLFRRRELLDGVVFSGGEPLLQSGLVEALREVRAMGYATGLHTAGAYPRRLEQLLSADLLDWVGFDVKAPPARYDDVTATPGSLRPAARSLRALLDSGVAHQLRTTIDPDQLGPRDLADLDRWLHDLGAGPTLRQPVRHLSTGAR
ncbi:anaerobic ribonucleoside-triphosphate reductase activating protein [Nocardia sp. ET3-3]|uniref:Anaerobic ribonucleoside-triphosphate reductase activating protein n=1 Tax=Nocardia terrae TaxID=2675851 RepID=A0A7K1UP77_9NOCA|nr:anaerobic ribonucleoside-triphosphate reductase activating protein [Nocardia terrae]MVU76134.1 anaerobic ribonucleoside-triphosphate reductase activating protein [Nocardia terrae]